MISTPSSVSVDDDHGNTQRKGSFLDVSLLSLNGGVCLDKVDFLMKNGRIVTSLHPPHQDGIDGRLEFLPIPLWCSHRHSLKIFEMADSGVREKHPQSNSATMSSSSFLLLFPQGLSSTNSPVSDFRSFALTSGSKAPILSSPTTASGALEQLRWTTKLWANG